ncbi:toxin-antitoxin system YwqK family antitoxin [Hymenobacter sp. DG01]|uniref:toxin-antitoxin system YwqK family antitoxin n=1 Tax=Hymenobacter sp. DG01 TaxID=2584940 RepID=UPI0011241D83|nr:hypothetical protein [Hymenobacter sp. DG01]
MPYRRFLLLFRSLRFLLAGALLLTSLPTLAQQPDSAQRATPAPARKISASQSYRILGPDSIALFYNADYDLCPPGCSAIRRHTRFDDNGQFFGYVRDFWMHNAQPALTGTYRNGLKDGMFEVFHLNGTLAVRAYYRAGKAVGNWAYWYPSGQKRQVLSFGAGNTLLIQQFWTEDGQQTVQDGQGSWYRIDGDLRVSGAVAKGRPDGKWRVQETTGKQKVLAEETFSQGRFRTGVTRPSGVYYYDASRIYITDLDTYSQAEEFVVYPDCPSAPPKAAAQ